MITALALAAIVAQGPKTLIQQIGVPFDPENGYFDYLMAAELMRSDRAGLLLAAVQNPDWARAVIYEAENPPREVRAGQANEEKGGYIPRPPETVAFARKIVKMTPLEVKRLAKSELKDVLTLVDRARNKRVWEPRKSMYFSTIFPEFTHLRNVNRLLAMIVADVGFADGQEKEAITALLDSFRVAEASGVSSTLIGVLVKRAAQTISLRAIEKHMPRFTIADCRVIQQYATEQLEEREDFKVALAGERKMVTDFLENMFTKNPEEMVPEAMAKMLAAIPEQLRPALIREAKSLYDDRTKGLAELFSKSEGDWASYLDSKGPEPESSVTEQSPITHLVVEMMIPSLDQVLSSALLTRVQMRLLRAAMAVRIHRWTYDKLPAKLDEITPAEIIKDPVTGANFRYRVKDDFFELIGTGSREHGEIRLVYRRPAGGGGEPPPPNQ